MSNFSKSFSKELGKNTGKWVSNKVFGNGHSTPHRVIIQRERSERAEERSRIRQEREYEKQQYQEDRARIREERHQQKIEEYEAKKEALERRQKAAQDRKAALQAERELKLWIREWEKEEKERIAEEAREDAEYEKQKNLGEASRFNNYIQSLHAIHKNISFDIDWNEYILPNENFNETFLNRYLNAINYVEDSIFTKEEAVLHLLWMVALAETVIGDSKSVSKEEDEYFSKVNKKYNWVKNFDKFNEDLKKFNYQTFDQAINILKTQSFYWKVKTLGLMRKMYWIDSDKETKQNGNRKSAYDLIIDTSQFFFEKNNEYIRYGSHADVFLENIEPPIINNIILGNLNGTGKTIPDDIEIPPLRPDSDDEMLLKDYSKPMFEYLKSALSELQKNNSEKHGKNQTLDNATNQKKELESQKNIWLNIKKEEFDSSHINYTSETKQLAIDYNTNTHEHDELIYNEANRSSISKIFNKSEVSKNENRLAELTSIKEDLENKLATLANNKINDIDNELEKIDAAIKDLKFEMEYKMGVDYTRADYKTIHGAMLSHLNEKWSDTFESVENDFLMHYMALSMLDKNADVYKASLSIFPIYDIVNDYGSTILPKYHNNGIEMDLFININDVVPIEKKTSTQAGKLSTSGYPAPERNDIIQDYVCSMILRVARETFSFFVENNIIINVYDKILNKATGILEDAIIISVFIERQKLETINVEHIDPSDCIESFEHNMNFDRKVGFKAVESVPISMLITEDETEDEIEDEENTTIKPKNVQKTQETQANSIAPEKSIIPDVTTQKEIIKNNESSVKNIEIKPSMEVEELKGQFLNLFAKQITVYTTSGNVAGDKRKLRALTDKEIKGKINIELKNIDEASLTTIFELTGLTIKFA